MGARSCLVMMIMTVAVLSGCDQIDTMKDGMAHSQAVSADLAKSLGLKSFVGFNVVNGQLKSVTITFAGIPDQKSLTDIAAASKQAVSEEFKQMPGQLIVAFATQS